jgi:hypothetical protein
MNGEVVTREFSIRHYKTALELWKKMEEVEIAEGNSEDEIARYLKRNQA